VITIRSVFHILAKKKKCISHRVLNPIKLKGVKIEMAYTIFRASPVDCPWVEPK